VLARLCDAGSAGTQERWSASSHTATAITGDVRFSPSRIAFENGKALPLTLFDKASSFKDDIEGGVTADIYKVVTPADPILLNGNRLCGGTKPLPVTFIAVWKSNSGGVWMASSSSATKPKDMSDICGTFGYEPAPSFSTTGKPNVRRHFGVDSPGDDRGSWIRHVGTVDDCENICLADPGCAGYTYNARRSTCIPKNRIGALVRHNENPVTGVILGRGRTTAPQAVQIKGGVYRIKNSHSKGELSNGELAVRQEPDKSLKLSFTIDYPKRSDAVSSLTGRAKYISANHWLYQACMNSGDPDDQCPEYVPPNDPGNRCAVDITLDQKGWHFDTREGADCINFRGFHAQAAYTPDFPLDSFVGPVTNQLDESPNLQPAAHDPAPARELPAAAAHAESSPPSYLGRWMDNPNCRPPYENEFRFSTRSMDGDELSCRFDRIRGGAGRWHIRMSCHGEGGTERREVDILVEGNTMRFKEGGNTSKKTRCP
jgi:hypothetical protein